MAFEMEKAEALRLLRAIEEGTQSTTATFQIAESQDPTLIYFIFAWLRARYPASHPAADAVLNRLGELCSRHPKVARMANEGKKDSLVEWFEQAYGYRDFQSSEFVDLVVEKLES